MTQFNTKSSGYIFGKQLINKIESLYFCSIPRIFRYPWYEYIRYNYECEEENCYRDVDGYWITKSETNEEFYKFIWRIHPNYCCYGKPYYSSDEIEEIFKKSETKKYILRMNNFEVCLEWDGFNPPTRTHWGLEMKDPYITIYKNKEKIYKGSSIYKRDYKNHLLVFLTQENN